MDFREDGGKRKKRENGRENIFCDCLDEGSGGKKLVGLGCFLLRLTKFFSLQIGEKLERTKMYKHGKMGKNLLTRLEPAHFFLFKKGQPVARPFLVGQPDQPVDPFKKKKIIKIFRIHTKVLGV